MRISNCSSDVCLSDLDRHLVAVGQISRITSALTLDSRHHAGCHVVEVMTVKRPSTWIVRVESDCQFALGRQPDGVAPRARKAPAIDGHNMEVVAVQEIGRASCRERGGQYVWVSLVAVGLQKKKKE